MKKVLLAISFGILLMGIISCAPSREDQIKARLDSFKAILPDQIRTDFENESYDAVVLQVDSLLASDPVFRSRWEEMKAAEAINLFSTREVIDYFVEYFVNYRERP